MSTDRRSPGALLRDRLQDSGIVAAMGIHDGLTARIAAQAGFDVLYHGGYAVAAHIYGMPDIGLLGLGEMADNLSRVTNASAVPVITDADTG